MRLREAMPELSGATEWINGNVTKANLVGEKPTLIHFWSVSCHLCKKVFPQINEFRDNYSEELNIVAVHMPRKEEDLSLEAIQDNVRQYGLTQPIFVDGTHSLTNLFGNQYVPAYYLFDKDGLLRHYQAGGGGMQMLEKRILRLLGETAKNS